MKHTKTNMANVASTDAERVASFTIRYTKKEIRQFAKGNFGDHDPLDALTHLAVVIGEKLH